jgi:hypothetical protein
MMAEPLRNPHRLPTKTCPVCNREFTWRKKWERNWDEIRYCSDKCRGRKAPLSDAPEKTGSDR